MPTANDPPKPPGTDPSDDSAHLPDSRAGDAAVWEEFAQTVLPKVRQALHRRFGADRSSADADGAVQSAVRILLRELRTPDKPLPKTGKELECWLVVTAWRKLRDQRAKGRKHERAEISELATVEEEPLDQLLAVETAERLTKLSRRLDERLDDDRRAILALWTEGRSQRAIANELGITRSRVETAPALIFELAARLWHQAEGS